VTPTRSGQSFSQDQHGLPTREKTVASALRPSGKSRIVFLYLSGRSKAELGAERYTQILEDLKNNITR